MKYSLFINLIILIFGLHACARLQYKTLRRQYDFLDTEIPTTYHVYRPEKSIKPDISVGKNRIQEIDGYVFRLFIKPYPPRAHEKVELDLAVQESKTEKPVMDLDVQCRAIMRNKFFINRCEQPHQKDSMGHYPISVKYSTAGSWQLRFEVKTPEGKILKPVFTISVK